MQQTYSLTRDPTYYVMAGFFALLTTAVPALLGQPRFLPLIQALILTVFIAIPLRKGHVRGALNVLTIWLPLQFALMALLSWAFGGLVERAITDGFVFRGELAAWFYTGTLLPRGLQAAPGARLGELAGIILGSLLTGGLLGSWFLVRAVDLMGFATGSLFSTLETPLLIPAMIPLWSLVRIAGYAGIVTLFAEPLLTNNRSPAFYWNQRRRLVVISFALLIAGLLLELVYPALVVQNR